MEIGDNVTFFVQFVNIIYLRRRGGRGCIRWLESIGGYVHNPHAVGRILGTMEGKRSVVFVDDVDGGFCKGDFVSVVTKLPYIVKSD